MTARRAYSRHGLNAAKARVKLRGLGAIDQRTAAARSLIARRREYKTALGGDLSPQRERLLDMLTRGEAYLDHVDAVLFEQESLINKRSRSLLPVLVQRQALADHCARLLDRLGLDRVPAKVQSIADVLRDYPATSTLAARAAPETRGEIPAAVSTVGDA